MIVPRSRLLVWTAVAAVPLAGLAIAVPGALPAGAAGLAAFGVLALADAALSRRLLDGISVEVPPLVRLAAERQGEIDVRIRNREGKTRELRLALLLPEAIPSANEEVRVLLPVDAETSACAWRCRPLRRGRFRLDQAAVETSSQLGFWAVRRFVPAPAELRVYPNLLRESRDVAAIFLKRGVPGVHAHRQVGKGREFEQLREYIPGDSFEDIHWKATAKRGLPTTKVFQIERTQEVYLVLDSSRLSARPAAGPEGNSVPVLDRAVVAALLLALAAERQGDLFGLVTFSDRVGSFLRAGAGRSHFNACRDALYALQPSAVSPDFDELCVHLRLRLRRRALLIFLTDLDDPLLAESFVKNAGLLHRRHVVIAAMRRPPEAAPLFSDPEVTSVDDCYRALAGHFSWQDLRELTATLRRSGVELVLLEDQRWSADLISRYLRVKQRQLL